MYVFNCHPFCASCYGENANNCLSCPIGATLNTTANSCYCPSGFALQAIPNCVTTPCSSCKPCRYPCSDCYADNDAACKSCICGFYYYALMQ